MRKHLYLHTSNLNDVEKIKKDSSFEGLDQYSLQRNDLYRKINCHENEYCRIRTKENYYHIVVGNVKQKNCPWCGHQVIFKNIFKAAVMNISEHSKYCMICTNCGARGPVLNVADPIENNPDHMQMIVSMVEKRFEYRRQWDSDFINSYENTNASQE